MERKRALWGARRDSLKRLGLRRRHLLCLGCRGFGPLVQREMFRLSLSRQKSGITWVHRNGRSPETFPPETVGGGCGFNVGRHNHWLGLKLVAKRANPDALGAIITWQAGDLKRPSCKTGGGSYLASHDPRVVLGIGSRPTVDWVEIKWPLPSGRLERFTHLPFDQYTTLVEGTGKSVSA